MYPDKSLFLISAGIACKHQTKSEQHIKVVIKETKLKKKELNVIFNGFLFFFNNSILKCLKIHNHRKKIT